MENKIKKAFDNVHASEALINSTKAFVNAKRSESHKRKSRVSFKAVTAVCASLLIVSAAVLISLNFIPVSYISIDINPSVELSLNCFGFVVDSKAYNDDGELILDSTDVNGKNYTDAIELIVSGEEMKNYLSDNSALTFTVASQNEDTEKKILRDIENSDSCKNNRGCGYGADTELIDEAHEYGLSFGKYSAYLKLKSYDDSVTTEDCKSMTMAEIRSLINGYQGTDSSEKGYGKGNGNGECSNSDNVTDSTCSGNKESGHGSGNGNGKGNGTGNAYGKNSGSN